MNKRIRRFRCRFVERLNELKEIRSRARLEAQHQAHNRNHVSSSSSSSYDCYSSSEICSTDFVSSEALYKLVMRIMRYHKGTWQLLRVNCLDRS